MQNLSVFVITGLPITFCSFLGWILSTRPRFRLIGQCMLCCSLLAPWMGLAFYLFYPYFSPLPKVVDPPTSSLFHPQSIGGVIGTLLFFPAMAFISLLTSPSVEAAIGWEIGRELGSFLWSILMAILGWLPLWGLIRGIQAIRQRTLKRVTVDESKNGP